MGDTQGRGAYYDDARLEKAAKRAKENGGGDTDVRRAAENEFGSATSELMNSIRQKMNELF